MFRSDLEYAAYKAVELEGAVNDVLAERRTTMINAGEETGSLPDSLMLEARAQVKPLTLWIDKVTTKGDRGGLLASSRRAVSKTMTSFHHVSFWSAIAAEIYL